MPDIICSICTNRLTGNSDVVITPCRHLFDKCCLLRWLDHSSTCPQCRAGCTKDNIRKVYVTSSSEARNENDSSDSDTDYERKMARRRPWKSNNLMYGFASDLKSQEYPFESFVNGTIDGINILKSGLGSIFKNF